MKRPLKIGLITVGLLALAAFEIYRSFPIERIGMTSQLVMLGDLNCDNAWNQTDHARLAELLADPFRSDRMTLLRLDVNHDQMISAEDTSFLERLYSCSDPYVAEAKAQQEHQPFPRPREFFKYLPEYEYVQSPIFTLENDLTRQSPLDILAHPEARLDTTYYQSRLRAEAYSEAVRFSSAYRLRAGSLGKVERDYADKHIASCNELTADGDYYLLLLNLIGLVEDAETLRYGDQTEFIQKILYCREHFRDLLNSSDFRAFEAGSIPCDSILHSLERYIAGDLNIHLVLDTLPPPRSFLKLENYIDRFEWQKYKSKSGKDEFLKLLLFAQYDRRYLRAVAQTSPRHEDPILDNHNLPMILLFREALRITGGDKKAAVGLLDEALRIPFSWIKSIPRKLLPSSVALENFLLPGNMEDGSDKSRHWNVFGGIALYRSPEESFVVALEREVADLKGAKRSPDAMREFIRDMIADINGIYYIMSIDDGLIAQYAGN